MPINSPLDVLGAFGQTAQDWGNALGQTFGEGPHNIAEGVQTGDPLRVAGGLFQTGLSPISAIGKLTTEPQFGALANTVQGHPLSTYNEAVQGFQRMPLGAQMAAYTVSPFSKLGSLAETPEIIPAAEGALTPTMRMAAQGAMSKAAGLALDNPISQIETLYAKYNPAQLALSGAGKVANVASLGLLPRLMQMTPMGKGLRVADLQSAVVKKFGTLLNNASQYDIERGGTGINMTPDQFFSQQRVLQTAKADSDAAKAAALNLQDVEDKITNYTRGEAPGVQNIPLGPAGSNPGLEAGAQGVNNAITNTGQSALPPPSRVIHMTYDEWSSNVKKALKDNGDQTSYIVTDSGQRYAVSPIPPGGSLRQRIFNGTDIRTQTGENVPLRNVVQIQNAQGQEVGNFPPYAAIVHPPATPGPVPPLGDLPSSRDQALADQAHASDWIQGVVKDLQAAPISDNLSQRLQNLGIDPNQLSNALKVRAGVQGKVVGLQNAQVKAMDDIASQFPSLIANGPDDILKNKAFETLQSASEPFARLRNAVQQGKSYVDNGDLTGLTEDTLSNAVDKGTNDLYQRSFAKTQEPSALGKWAQRTINPVLGGLVNTGLAMQAGVDPVTALGFGGLSALAQATPAGRALGMALKQSKRAMPGWTYMMQSDEGMRSALNGVAPFITPGSILSNATQWGDVGPGAEEALANLGANGNFNPYSRAMEDALSSLQFGPLTHEGQVQSEAAMGQRGLGKLGEYLLNLTGGKLGTGTLADYMSKGETSLNRMMSNQDMLMRASAAIQGKKEVMNKVAPYFAQSIRDVSPTAADAIESSGGAVSQSKLADLLSQDGIAGDNREGILGQWQNLLDTGTNHGIDLANKIHYNYRYGTGMDQFMNQFLLNHTWATRNLQNYPQMLAEHPWTLPMIGDFLDSLNERRNEANGTLRFLGMVPGDSALEKTLGMLGDQQGQAFTDPTQGVSIVSQLLPLWKAATHMRPGESLGNTLLDSMGGLSMGMQPLSQMGLQAAGAIGERSYSPLFAAANAGVNLAQAHGAPMGDQPTNLDPFSAVANTLKQLRYGYQPNTTSRDIQREVENLSIEQGLGPNSQQAKMAANDPNSPLWQAAARRVAGQKGTQELGRIFGTPNVEFEAPGEQTTQRMAGDPLWQPNLNDPLEAGLFQLETGLPVLGNDQMKKRVEGFMQLQKDAYNRERINAAVQSPAVVELLARAANSNNGAIQKLLQDKGLSATGGNNPTILGTNGQPISPDLARAILVESNQTAPEFSQAGQVVRETAAVPPAFRRPMVNAPSAEEMQVIRGWDSGDPAIRAQILSNPQSRAIIAQRKGIS